MDGNRSRPSVAGAVVVAACFISFHFITSLPSYFLVLENKRKRFKQLLKGAGVGLGCGPGGQPRRRWGWLRALWGRPSAPNSNNKDNSIDAHQTSLRGALAVPTVARLKSALSLAAAAGLERGPLVDAARAELERVEAAVLHDLAKAEEDAELSPSELAKALFLAGAAVDQDQWDQGRARYLEMTDKATAGSCFFPHDHIKADPDAFDKKLIPDELKAIASARREAKDNVTYWTGDPQPWRFGADTQPITDQATIDAQETLMQQAEDEDAAKAATEEKHTTRQRGLGVRVDFLLWLTAVLGLWDLTTYQVQQFIIKPMTELYGRCRFADLEFMQPFIGPATVFMSHCWGGKWGDLVAAACAGGNLERFVWIDIMAVRQWPGNLRDLNFRGIINQCTALVVAAAPMEGKVCESFIGCHDMREFDVYLASEEYALASKQLPFCRLWCVVELAAALSFGKPIVFACLSASASSIPSTANSADCGGVVSLSREGASNMLLNFSFMVNVSSAACAVVADKIRELAMIGLGNLPALNKAVASSMIAGRTSIDTRVSEVDAYACGEPAALWARLQRGDLNWKDALGAAASGGHKAAVFEVAVMAGLRDLSTLNDYLPLFRASGNGHVDVVKVLVEAGARVDLARTTDGVTPLLMASQNGHVDVVKVLVEAGASVDQATTTHGVTPLFMAAQDGRVDVVKVLVEAGASVGQARTTNDGRTPLWQASQNGHVDVVKMLVEAGASVNQARTTDGVAPLYMASENGHVDVVKLLVEAGSNVDKAHADDGRTPLWQACQNGHVDVVKTLVEAGASVNQARTTDGVAPPYIASENGHVDVVKVLVEAGASVNQARADDGRTPLWQACQNGHVDVVKVLVDAGASVNQARTDDGRTPLWQASQNGHADVVKVLVEVGASVDHVRTTDGVAPLLVAAQNGHVEVVKVLVGAGASEANFNAWTPLSIASFQGHVEVERFLRTHESRRRTK